MTITVTLMPFKPDRQLRTSSMFRDPSSPSSPSSPKTSPRMSPSTSQVGILPSLVERGIPHEICRANCTDLEDPIRRLKEARSDLRVWLTHKDHSKLWASSFFVFLRDHHGLLPPSPAVSIIVSHGNLIRSVLEAAGFSNPSVPNGAAVRVSIRDMDFNGRVPQDFFLVRHCPTFHNITGRGDSRHTLCASDRGLRGMRRLARKLREQAVREGRDPLRDVVFFSSAMPRAWMTALVLQGHDPRHLLPHFREALELEEDLLSKNELEAFERSQGCGSFCKASETVVIDDLEAFADT